MITESASAPSTFTRSVNAHKNRRHHQRVTCHPRAHQTLHNSLPLACEEQDEQDQWPEQQLPDSRRSPWRGHRSDSLFSLPNLGSGSSHSTCSSPGPSSSCHTRSRSLKKSPSLVPPFRLNVDALVGAEETDVDTGNKVNPGSSVDLSVVSAYIKSSLAQTPRPLSAPPEDIRANLSPVIPENAYRSATLGRTPNSFSIKTNPSAFQGSHPQSTSLSTSAAPSSSDMSINQSDSCSTFSAAADEVDKVEEDQEFYIWSLLVGWDLSVQTVNQSLLCPLVFHSYIAGKWQTEGSMNVFFHVNSFVNITLSINPLIDQS